MPAGVTATMRALFLFVCIMLFLMHPLWAKSVIPPFDLDTAPPAPDYAEPGSWLALPKTPGAPPHPVDVFWVYPTVVTAEVTPDSWLQDITDASLTAKAAGTLERQASALTDGANLYAPLYRQANVAVLGVASGLKEEIMAPAHEDVWRAFMYYLKNYNDGRPFIIAGHSQGSNILLDLALEHWGATGAEERLVAAYLIGWSITEQDLAANPALEICRDALQTGCFISYNSVAEGRQQVAPTIRPGSVVVNPLTWTTGSEFAPAEKNRGAVFWSAQGEPRVYEQFASAQVQDGGLVVRAEDPDLLETPGSLFPEGVYHAWDYSLFYKNLGENAAARIRAMRGQ